MPAAVYQIVGIQTQDQPRRRKLRLGLTQPLQAVQARVHCDPGTRLQLGQQPLQWRLLDQVVVAEIGG